MKTQAGGWAARDLPEQLLRNEALWLDGIWFLESWLLPLCHPQVNTCHRLTPGPPPAMTQSTRASPALPPHKAGQLLSYSPPWSISRSRGAAQPRGMLTPGAWKRHTAEGGPGPGVKGPEQLTPSPCPSPGRLASDSWTCLRKIRF